MAQIEETDLVYKGPWVTHPWMRKKFNIFYKLLISFTLLKTFLKKLLDQYAKILTMQEQKIIISMILEI
jgi:hypothetical protein